MDKTKYDPVKFLGRGSFGKVILTRKLDGPDIDVLYAMKVMSKRRNSRANVINEKNVSCLKNWFYPQNLF